MMLRTACLVAMTFSTLETTVSAFTPRYTPTPAFPSPLVHDTSPMAVAATALLPSNSRRVKPASTRKPRNERNARGGLAWLASLETPVTATATQESQRPSWFTPLETLLRSSTTPSRTRPSTSEPNRALQIMASLAAPTAVSAAVWVTSAVALLLEPSAAAASVASTTTLAPTPTNTALPNTVQAHVLTALSHLGLDLAVFFVPGLLILRVLAIVGRLCTMAADYIPDHFIFPEELAFQIIMLTLAWVGLFQAALLPMVSSTVQTMSLRDGRAYLALFQPAGTTWTNYKALSACALDWMTLEAGQTWTTDPATHDYVYWLYTGTVHVVDADGTVQSTLHRTVGKSFKHDAGCGLIGERRLIPSTQPSKSQSHIVMHADAPATLLRIHVPSLKLFMDHDANLAESIRTLVFQGMDAKLSHTASTSTAALMSLNATVV